jgi:septum site-determining protein MinD
MACRFVVVGAARDGVGKTTFAVNIALSLLKETRKRVLLVDLDTNAVGDCATLLGVTEARTVADFIPYVDQLTPQSFGPYIQAHPSGLGLLPLATTPQAAIKLPADGVQKLLDLAAPLCDYVVVDAGAGVDPVNVRMMERAAGIFLVASATPTSLAATRQFADHLQSLHFPQALVKFVVNDHDAAGPLSKEAIAARLGRAALVVLQRDQATTLDAALRGAPFVSDNPRAVISRTYDSLARQLVEKGVLDQLAAVERGRGQQVEAHRGVEVTQERDKAIAGFLKARGGNRGKSQAELDGRTRLKMLIHKRLPEVLDLKRLDREVGTRPDKDKVLRERAEAAVARMLDEEGAGVTDRNERRRIVKEVCDEALGLGPLEDLLADDRVTEIMVNGRDNVFAEVSGKLRRTEYSFTDDAQLLAVIERIVTPLGRRIDEKSPMVDARLADGSRVNAIIPPLAIDGPSITIRKFARTPLGVPDLIRFGSLTPDLADLLRACVEARLNIVISGGTGSGKTTLLNVLSSFIPEDDRIVTIEDAAELQLRQPHIVRLESRPANIEGVGEVKIRDLVKNSLRMRPDRIVVGECRGAEAVDMLQAMNTGHDGSLTTVHANSPRDALARLETLVMFAGLDLPSRAIREQIMSAIHIIVQVSRLSDGSRRILSVCEVSGMEAQTITMQEVFAFKQTGVDANRKVLGTFGPTGFVPKFVSRLGELGIELPRNVFASPAAVQVPRGRA